MVWTHWYRRDSVAKSRSWELVVFGEGRLNGPFNFGAVKISKEETVGATCDEFSNPQYPRITCVILSNCCHFSHLDLFYKFLSSYQTLSSLQLFYTLNFTSSTHHINMYPLYSSHLQLYLCYQPALSLPTQVAYPSATRGLLSYFPVEITVVRIWRTRRNPFVQIL